MNRQPPDVLERLLFHADRVEECGHLNAARYMRLAAEELEELRTIQSGSNNVVKAVASMCNELKAAYARIKEL